MRERRLAVRRIPRSSYLEKLTQGGETGPGRESLLGAAFVIFGILVVAALILLALANKDRVIEGLKELNQDDPPRVSTK